MVIKLARVELLVTEIRNESETVVFHDAAVLPSVLQHLREVERRKETDLLSISSNSGSCKDTRQCKVCLQGEDNSADKLVAPCQCRGSCRYIHLECLREWVKSKVRKEHKGIVTSYCFRKWECELCKTPLPKSFFVDDREEPMLRVERPRAPYVILEKLHPSTEKDLFVIYPGEGEVAKIGRGYGCEVKLNDISTSRNHAEICLAERQFFIRDNQAKFGTLLSRADPIEVASSSVRLQCSRTTFEFTQKLPDQEQN